MAGYLLGAGLVAAFLIVARLLLAFEAFRPDPRDQARARISYPVRFPPDPRDRARRD